MTVIVGVIVGWGLTMIGEFARWWWHSHESDRERKTALPARCTSNPRRVAGGRESETRSASLIFGRRGTHALSVHLDGGTSTYRVTFDQDVTACYATASPDTADVGAEDSPGTTPIKARHPPHPR